jgi:hypothetical protein
VKISFCNAIPRSLIFLFAQKVSHLAAFDGMPAKFLGWIHGQSPVQESKILGRTKGSIPVGKYLIVYEIGDGRRYQAGVKWRLRTAVDATV